MYVPALTPSPGPPSPWSTLATRRDVLAVVHNVTAATRLLDAVSLLAADPRVQVVFTRTGSSVFDEDTSAFLLDRGAREIPWSIALGREFDLAVSASHGGELHRIQAPLVIIPHGMGYNKFLETGNRKPETGNRKPETGNRKPETGNRKPVFGLSPEWLLHEGQVIPSMLVLSHWEQLDRLRLACPEAVQHSVVAGDLCFDRLSASKPLRPAYRQAFGLAAGEKLVVVSSTWGPDSLLGEAPQLARAVAATLPVDEFRLVLALHPNIWARHSRWQVLEWLASCRRHGVHVSQDVDEWQAAIVAADIVLGDQGSVSFYSSALGNPLLLAAAPAHTVDPESPIARLLAVAPRLDLSADIPGQLRVALVEHDPARYAAITALTTSEPGQAATLLRREMYRLLRLPEPSDPVEVVTVPLPEQPLIGPDSHHVNVAMDKAGSASVSRFPAERIRARPAAASRGDHLVVGVREPLRRWLEMADVVLGETGPDVEAWIAGTLDLLPGCVLAAAPAGPRDWLIGDQAGRRRTVTGDPTACRVFVSVLYEWLSQGHGFDDIPPEWSIRLGNTEHRVTTTSRPRVR